MNAIFDAMNEQRERKKTTVSIIYGMTASGKSSLFRNAPDVLFIDLENRLNHIEGTFKSIKISSILPNGKSNIAKIQEVLATISNDYTIINRIKELISKKDTDGLKKAKDNLKEKYDNYFKVANNEISYPKLVIIDAIDDLKASVDRSVCEELNVEDLSALERNEGYGISRTRFINITRQIINLGVNVVMLAGTIDAKDAWNTKGKNIPNIGGGTAYDYISRKISGVFAIDINPDDSRVLLTNNNNSKWFIKNSFDKLDSGVKLPSEIPLNFEDVNKWFGWYTQEELDVWKKKNNLKKI